MSVTRRQILQGLAVAGLGNSFRLPVGGLSIGGPKTEIDDLIARSIVIDDLSGFDPTSSLPDAGFSAVKESGITIVGPTLGSVEPGDAYTSSVAFISRTL